MKIEIPWINSVLKEQYKEPKQSRKIKIQQKILNKGVIIEINQQNGSLHFDKIAKPLAPWKGEITN